MKISGPTGLSHLIVICLLAGDYETSPTSRYCFLEQRSVCNVKSWVCCSVADDLTKQKRWSVRNVGPDSASDTATSPVVVYGFKLERSERTPEVDEDGVPALLVGSTGVLRLFGSGWTPDTRFVLTDGVGKRGDFCEFPFQANQKVSLFTIKNN